MLLLKYTLVWEKNVLMFSVTLLTLNELKVPIKIWSNHSDFWGKWSLHAFLSVDPESETILPDQSPNFKYPVTAVLIWFFTEVTLWWNRSSVRIGLGLLISRGRFSGMSWKLRNLMVDWATKNAFQCLSNGNLT